jgi:DNA repair protein RAD16
MSENGTEQNLRSSKYSLNPIVKRKPYSVVDGEEDDEDFSDTSPDAIVARRLQDEEDRKATAGSGSSIRSQSRLRTRSSMLLSRNGFSSPLNVSDSINVGTTRASSQASSKRKSLRGKDDGSTEPPSKKKKWAPVSDSELTDLPTESESELDNEYGDEDDDSLSDVSSDEFLEEDFQDSKGKGKAKAVIKSLKSNSAVKTKGKAPEKPSKKSSK